MLKKWCCDVFECCSILKWGDLQMQNTPGKAMKSLEIEAVTSQGYNISVGILDERLCENEMSWS